MHGSKWPINSARIVGKRGHAADRAQQGERRVVQGRDHGPGDKLYHQPCMTVIWHTISTSFVRASGELAVQERDAARHEAAFLRQQQLLMEQEQQQLLQRPGWYKLNRHTRHSACELWWPGIAVLQYGYM